MTRMTDRLHVQSAHNLEEKNFCHRLLNSWAGAFSFCSVSEKSQRLSRLPRNERGRSCAGEGRRQRKICLRRNVTFYQDSSAVKSGRYDIIANIYTHGRRTFTSSVLVWVQFNRQRNTILPDQSTLSCLTHSWMHLLYHSKDEQVKSLVNVQGAQFRFYFAISKTHKYRMERESDAVSTVLFNHI